MLKYYRIPLIFLFIGSLLGVFLRWQFISPTPGVRYSFFLHAHSHIMFLGWLFNALFIAVCHNHILNSEVKVFRQLFWFLQICIVGMLIAFPLQGYGFCAILFSTLHTVGAIFFIIKFFSRTKGSDHIAVWFARIGMIFFVISTAGPFSLGYLMSQGMGQSNCYFFSIYFYLHFQYNGFFLFVVLSIFFDLLSRKGIACERNTTKFVGWLLTVTCVPAYLLSVLWAKPGVLFNIIGGVASVVQVVACVVFVVTLRKVMPEIKASFARTSYYTLGIVLVAFSAKLLLQLLSALPHVAKMAYELRPIVIAYLHLVLIGIISMVVLVWYIEQHLLNNRSMKATISFFLFSFLGLELCLTMSPWWTAVFGSTVTSSKVVFIFSALLCFGCLALLRATFAKKLTKVRV